MGPLSRVQAHPKSGSLRTEGVKPFLILGDLGLSYLEFIAPCRRGLNDAARKKHEKNKGESFHDLPPFRNSRASQRGFGFSFREFNAPCWRRLNDSGPEKH